MRCEIEGQASPSWMVIAPAVLFLGQAGDQVAVDFDDMQVIDALQ